MMTSGSRPPRPPDLSPSARDRNLEALAARAFDVLVVGAGINGAAVACELAQQGLDVALIDAGDFASETSMSSGGLIWGGIKYLSTLHVGLVARLCAERDRFVARAPHCLRERRFLAPVYEGDPYGVFTLAWGTRLYWAFSAFRRSHRPDAYRTPEALLGAAPHLLPGGLTGGVAYTDVQIVTGDAHLAFEVVRTAAAHGAVVANYVEAAAFRRDGDRVSGVDAVDRLTGRPFAVRAKMVVNAGGTRADRLNARAGFERPPHRLVLRRGTFLNLPCEAFDAPPEAVAATCVVIQSAGDRRPFFVVPWGPTVMVGTTDLDHDPDALDDVRTTPDEIAFIFRELRGRFRLKPGVDASHVIASRVGVRPLAVRAGADAGRSAGEEALALSRDHAVDLDRRLRFVAILGGKITPARAVGAEVAHKIARHLPEVWAGRTFSDTRHVPLWSARGLYAPAGGGLPGGVVPGGVSPDVVREAFTGAVAREAVALGIPDAAFAAHLVAHHGDGAPALLDRIRADRSLAGPVIPGLPYCWAEVRALAEQGMVMTLDDLLRRRTNIAQWTPDGGFGRDGEHAAAVRRVAEEIARARGAGAPDPGAIVEAYRALVTRRNAWREAVSGL
jgi:glycerol-3-phosphate dehydrogenase